MDRFDQLCDIIGDAIKSVPSEKVIKMFKQTLFSLPTDGSRDQAEGSKKLLKLQALQALIRFRENIN